MSSQTSIINTIKVWIFPAVVMTLSTMMWSDVKEIQSDVKKLMSESNISSTKIENVESRVDKLEQVVFMQKFSKAISLATSQPAVPENPFKKQVDVKMYAVLKNEEDEQKKNSANL